MVSLALQDCIECNFNDEWAMIQVWNFICKTHRLPAKLILEDLKVWKIFMTFKVEKHFSLESSTFRQANQDQFLSSSFWTFLFGMLIHDASMNQAKMFIRIFHMELRRFHYNSWTFDHWTSLHQSFQLISHQSWSLVLEEVFIFGLLAFDFQSQEIFPYIVWCEFPMILFHIFFHKCSN